VRIDLVDISHSYDGGKTWAISNINLSFESGKRYSILGPSGCGKTTILKIIVGAITPTRGKVLIDGHDVTYDPPEKRKVAIVFQFPVVFKMTVLENLMFPLLNIKISKSEKIKKAKHVAELLGIEDLLKLPAQKLGPADRQKVSIGMALMKDTPVILLDEPMSSIEPDKRYELKQILLEISNNLRKTIIFVTHDQSEALTFGDMIAVMSDKGTLLQFGSFEEIYYSPSHEFVGFFIGFPGMNILEGILREKEIDLGPYKMKLTDKKIPLEIGEKLKVGIRPEHVKVELSPRDGFVPFDVVYLEELGTGSTILHLRNQNLFLKARVSFDVSNLTKVYVNIPEKYAVFFDLSGNKIS